MNDVKALLEESVIQYLATVGLDGKPKVRPFQFMLESNGKFFFSTANTKRVFQEIQQQPFVEFCAINKNHSWLRMSGKVVFSSDIRIKEAVINSNPMIKAVFKSADNQTFEVFYLSGGEAIITDESSAAPKVFKL